MRKPWGWISCWPVVLPLAIACASQSGGTVAANPGVAAAMPTRCDSFPTTADSADYQVFAAVNRAGPASVTAIPVDVNSIREVLRTGQQQDLRQGFILRPSPASVFVYAQTALGKKAAVSLLIGQTSFSLTGEGQPTVMAWDGATQPTLLEPRILQQLLPADSLGSSPDQFPSGATG